MILELLAITHWFIAIGFMLRVIYRRIPVGSSLAWIGLLASVPIGGIVIYLLIGEQKMGRRRSGLGEEIRALYRDDFVGDLDATLYGKSDLTKRELSIARVAAQETGFLVREGNKMELLETADEFYDHLLMDIHAAQSLCFLEYYIIDAQGRVEEVLQAVGAAARRGVACRVLADAVGSAGFFRSSWPRRLREAGVEVHTSLPVGIFKALVSRSDLRNHRKIALIDERTAYTGSHNLADPAFFKQHKNVGQWVDVSLRCQGPVVKALMAVFCADVMMEESSEIDFERSIKQVLTDSDPQGDEFSGIAAQVLPSGPEQESSVIYETLVSAIYTAQQQIFITTPYFVPDDALLLALISAARRGVDVTLIVPKKIDSFLVHHTSRAYFRDLLNAGIKIAQYQEGLLHSKIISIDGEMCLIGTANIDIRSFYLNLEITLAIYDDEFCQRIIDLQKTYVAKAEFIDAVAWMQRGKAIMMFENTVRLTSPLL
ncbi:MAG: cardiolipin synthase [Parvularculaceae bacterium]